MRYIWKYFTALNRKRAGTGYGPLAIPHSEILAYFQLHNIQYEPIEVEILEILDDVTMEYYTGQIQKDQEKQRAKLKK